MEDIDHYLYFIVAMRIKIVPMWSIQKNKNYYIVNLSINRWNFACEDNSNSCMLDAILKIDDYW